MIKKIVAIAAIVIAISIAGHVNVATYNALNAGVVVSGFGHCAGVEVKGAPGVFVDVDC